MLNGLTRVGPSHMLNSQCQSYHGVFKSDCGINVDVCRSAVQLRRCSTFVQLCDGIDGCSLRVGRRWLLNYLRTSSWSFSSNIPSLRCTLWSKLVPWKPLPRPSKRTATTPKLLTSTDAQSTWNCSETDWLPGVPSLSETEKKTNHFY